LFIDAGLVGLNANIPVAIGRGTKGRQASGRLARVLYAGRDRQVQAAGAAGNRVDVYDRNGTLRASLRADGAGRFGLPASLGHGTYVYRALSAAGDAQGLLNLLP
jgi:hypothetical protein